MTAEKGDRQRGRGRIEASALRAAACSAPGGSDAARCAVHGSRRGSVLLIMLILTLVVMLVIGGLTQLYRLHAQYLDLAALRLQAERYAEAGLERAALLVAADGRYSGETWLPEEDTHGATGSTAAAESSKRGDGQAQDAERSRGRGEDDEVERWTVQIAVDRSAAEGESRTVTLRATAAFGTPDEARIRVTSERRVTIQ